MSAERDIEELSKLLASRGWAVLHETMTAEIVQAALAIANNTAMTEKEIDFRRGAIWAANQLLNLPQRLQDRLKTEIKFQQANSAAKAAQEK